MSRLLLTALLIVIGVGCAAEAPAPTEQLLGPAELARAGGCADVFLYAATAEGSVAVTVNWPDAAGRAMAEGEWRETVTLPDHLVRVTLQLGRSLADPLCNDVVTDAWLIMIEVPAASGEAEIQVVPNPGGEPFMPLGTARLVLRDVVFEVPVDDTTAIWRIELLELDGIQVGWLAG